MRATWVFALACLAGFIIVLTWLLVQLYQDSIARAETRAEAYSQVVSANVGAFLEGTYQALRRIDSAAGDGLENPSDDTLGDLSRAVENLPPNIRAWLIDTTGTPRLSNTQLSTAFNVADRDYFIGLKAGEAFRISPLMISRTGGDPVFAVAKRIERDGRFLGAAVIIVPAIYLDQLRGPLEVGPLSTLGLIRDDGMLVTRTPVPAETQDLSKYVLFTDYLPAHPEGTYLATSPTDGVQRIVAYRRVPNFPLIAIATMSTEEALAPFRQNLLMLTLFAVPGLIGLGTFAVWTIRSQAALAASHAQNQVLFREIHHRVKNNLQQGIALINMQPIPAEPRAEISRQFMAMAAVHEHMYGTNKYKSVLVSAVLPKLIEEVTNGFARPIRTSATVAPALIDREKALSIALIVSEVMANAAKHAFEHTEEATIRVTLERLSATRARLIVADNGIGYSGTPLKKGTGTKLLMAFARQLGAEATYEIEGGTKFSIEFDVEGFEEK